MVIGRPYSQPPERDRESSGEPGEDDEPDERDERDELVGLDEEGVGESVQLGPEGIDDPETEWELDDVEVLSDPLPPLDEDEIWLLVPGEDLLVVTNLPKARQLPAAIAIRPGEIAVCANRRREWSRTPLGASEEDDALPLAERLLVVFIRHRARGVRTKPRKYVIVTDADHELLGWLDYSDAWNFEGQRLKQMAEAAGLRYEIERYATEAEFEAAHPQWVN